MHAHRPIAPALVALGSIAVFAVGCAGDDSGAPAQCAAEWVYGEPSAAPDALSDERRRCTSFGAGDRTDVTIAADSPGIERLEHVVLLMLENRSFDHYFSDLPNAGVTDVRVARTQANPDGLGGRVSRYHETRFCMRSPGHEWNDAHIQYGAGRMDGFVTSSNPGGGRAMGYYTQADLRFYYFLAQSFAISDRHFSSLLGPTQPNRLFWLLGTSCGLAESFAVNPAVIDCGLNRKHLLDLLDDAQRSHKIYDASGVSTLFLALGIAFEIHTISEFVADAQNDRLADVSIVGASTGELLAPDGNDDHPPYNPQLGQQFLAGILTALRPAWNKSALIVSYDEHGGYYDHVAPPRACEPEKINQRDYRFDQYGFRVPLFVISPFARRGYVSHFDTDHTSILRFVEHWAGMPALTRRDANAWPLLDLFDFEQTPLELPNWDPQLTEISAAAAMQCAAHPEGETGLPP